YGGRLIRELSGPDLNEHNLITTSLNLSENHDPKGSPPTDPWSAASLSSSAALAKEDLSLEALAKEDARPKGSPPVEPTRLQPPTATAHPPETAPSTTSASE